MIVRLQWRNYEPRHEGNLGNSTRWMPETSSTWLTVRNARYLRKPSQRTFLRTRQHRKVRETIVSEGRSIRVVIPKVFSPK